MAFFAHFDSTSAAPFPVVGWYDTSSFEYPNLPPAEVLIAIAESQWKLHFQNPNGWVVSNRKIIKAS